MNSALQRYGIPSMHALTVHSRAIATWAAVHSRAYGTQFSKRLHQHIAEVPTCTMISVFPALHERSDIAVAHWLTDTSRPSLLGKPKPRLLLASNVSLAYLRCTVTSIPSPLSIHV